jgi:hypothetical protein
VIIAVLAVGIACVPLALYGSAGDEAGLGRLKASTTTQPPTTTRPTTTTRNFSNALTGPCAVADRLLIGGYLPEARAEYQKVLQGQPTTTASRRQPTTTASRKQPTTTTTSRGQPTTASRSQGDPYACVANGLAKLAQAQQPATSSQPTTSEPAGETPLGKGAADGLERIRRRLAVLWRLRLDRGEWIAALLVLLLALRVWALRRASRQPDPGPVEVALFEDGAGQSTAVQPKAMASLMRERLARAKLFPPATLPGAGGGDELLTVLEASSTISGSSIGKLLTAIRQLARINTGHRVSGTFIRRETAPQCGVTVQITDLGTGDTEDLRTCWATSYEEANIQATYIAAAAIFRHTNKPRERQWARWTAEDGRALRLYDELRQYRQNGEYDKAFAAGREAINLEPQNALIRLELAQVYEASNAPEDYLDALDIYLLTVTQWTDFHEARYRLAATLSFVEVWSPEWMAARHPTHGRHKQHERILEGLRELHEPKGDVAQVDTDDKKTFREAMLQRAVEQLEHIVGHEPSPRLKKLAQTASLVSRLQLGQDDAKLRRELEACLAKGSHPDWQVRYNAACFHARRISRIPVEQQDQAVKDALEQLTQVFSKGDMQTDAPELTPAMRQWLDQDPDLELLQDNPLYERWKLQTFGLPPAAKEPKDARRVAQHRATWTAIANIAEQRAQLWRQHAAELVPYRKNGKWLGDLRNWCRDERDVWAALLAWLQAPEEEKEQESARSKFSKVAGVTLDLAGIERKVFVRPGEELGKERRRHEADREVLTAIAQSLASSWADHAAQAQRLELGEENPHWPHLRTWAVEGEQTWLAFRDWSVPWRDDPTAAELPPSAQAARDALANRLPVGGP